MFRMLKIFFYLFVAWALFGCVAPDDEVSRSETLDLAPVVVPMAGNWGPAELAVHVPESLTVSESDVVRPVADIVWREDPGGDRHRQVQALIERALSPVIGQLDGDTPVRVEITVLQFHALTERARYTIGGTHEISFVLALRDPETGAPMVASRRVDLQLEAYGGRRAIAAEAAGQTQSVRITAHVQDWARHAFGLTSPL